MNEEMQTPDPDEIYLARKCSDCLHSVLKKEGLNQYSVYCCFAPASPTKVDPDLFCSYFEQGGSELLEKRNRVKDQIVAGDTNFDRSI
jgi:hypothetical protein